MLAQHPKMVIFDALTCCSLRCAYHNPEHSSVLHALGELLGSPHWIDVFGGIFNLTVRVGIIPEEKGKMFYGKLARAELEVLADLNHEALACGHAPREHVKALQAVSAKFPEIRAN